MIKVFCFMIMFFSFNLNAQLFENAFYFDTCKETYKLRDDTCVGFEMKKFVFEKIFNFIPSKDLNDKSDLRLNLKIDSTGIINSCFLTWREGKIYFLKDVKTKIKKINSFNTNTDVNVYYTIPENKSLKDAKLYITPEQIFKVVEVMPSLDSCYFGSKDYKSCANTKLIAAINKNMIIPKDKSESLTAGKVLFGMVIGGDGYIKEFNIYKNTAGKEVDRLLNNALKKLKSQKMRFMPGFQRKNPISVYLNLEYFFDPPAN